MVFEGYCTRGKDPHLFFCCWCPVAKGQVNLGSLSYRCVGLAKPCQRHQLCQSHSPVTKSHREGTPPAPLTDGQILLPTRNVNTVQLAEHPARAVPQLPRAGKGAQLQLLGLCSPAAGPVPAGRREGVPRRREGVLRRREGVSRRREGVPRTPLLSPGRTALGWFGEPMSPHNGSSETPPSSGIQGLFVPEKNPRSSPSATCSLYK